MALRFDSGFSTVLAVCEGCPTRWRFLAGSQEGAWAAARAHIEFAHDEPTDPTRVRFLSAGRQRARRK